MPFCRRQDVRSDRDIRIEGLARLYGAALHSLSELRVESMHGELARTTTDDTPIADNGR